MNPIPDPTKRLSEPIPETTAKAPDSRGKDLLSRFGAADRGVSDAERAALIANIRACEGEIAQLQERLNVHTRLVRCARSLSSILDPDALLGQILQEVVTLTGVDRGFLLLSDGGQLTVVCGHQQDGGRIENPVASRVSMSVAKASLSEGAVRRVSGAQALEEYRTQESIQDLRLDTIVCVPMTSREGPIGVLYLDSKRPESLPALREENGVLEAFAAQAAIAVENARLHRRLLDARTGLERENRDLRRALPGSPGVGAILGRSRRIEEVRRRIGQLQEVDCPVLILGDTGTGKDLVAQAIHLGSSRSSAPFQVINCGALPEDLLESELFGHRRGSFTGATENKPGLIEAAEGGTLFLDEIGEMPLSLQVKLLRVLENREIRRVGENQSRRVDVRVLSATNRDLEVAMAAGMFREDLYYRLRVVMLAVPRLRDRKEDILLLAEHFLQQWLREHDRPSSSFTPAAVRFLLENPWPGNVRELRNVLEGAAVFLEPGSPVDVEDLLLAAGKRRAAPVGAVPPDASLRGLREDMERQLLVDALEGNSWNVSRAAKALGISRQHLHNRIRRHGLHRPGSAEIAPKTV